MSENRHQKKTRAKHDGSIFQRKDGRWVAELDFGVIEGKRYRPVRYTDSQKEAREELQKLLKQRDTGAGRITPERLTVSDYLDSWLQTVQQRVGVKTHRTYGDFVRMHVKPHIGDLRLTKLRPDDVRGLMRTLLSKGLSPASVRHVRACLRCALNDAIKDSVLQTNAAERAEPPKVTRPQLKVLNGNDAGRLLDAARGARLEPILTLAIGLGLRQGELLGLDWTDIDFEKRQLSVRRQLQRVAGKLQRVELKTPSSRRTLSIPAFVVDTLRVQQARQENDRSLAGTDWAQTGSVFTTNRGTHLEARNMLRDYEKLRKRVGLSDVRFHDLRHGCATLLLMKGVPMKVLQEILGHGSFATTANVYSHVLPEMSRDAADKMDQVFDSMAVNLAVNQPGKRVN